jgi:hypothetical protein
MNVLPGQRRNLLDFDAGSGGVRLRWSSVVVFLSKGFVFYYQVCFQKLSL